MKIKDLKPADYNPRKISDKQLEMLKKALQEFGDLSGIVFNRKTGNLVGGHQRLKCLPPDAIIEKEKLKKPSRTGTVAEGYIILPAVIPAGSKRESRNKKLDIRVKPEHDKTEEKYTYREVDWPLEKEKAANIAANKHGGEFDDEKLGEILKELSEMPDFDLDLIGFEADELDNILSQIQGEGLIDDDEVPEVAAEPITKTGDLYILGKHRLLCGDATKKEDVEKLMDGKKADMVFTDPPYGINIVKGNKGFLGGGGMPQFGRKRQLGGKGTVDGKGIVKPRIYKKIIGDDKPFDPTFLMKLAPKIILWGANCFSSYLPGTNGWIVWDKGVSFDTNFSDCELAYTNVGKHIKKYEHRWSGMCRKGNRDEELKDRVHPTQKPVGLFSQILSDIESNLILDLFLGSGSTLIACEKTDRICYGMEIDPHYCDVIVARYCKYTGNNKVIKNGKEIEWQI